MKWKETQQFQWQRMQTMWGFKHHKDTLRQSQEICIGQCGKWKQQRTIAPHFSRISNEPKWMETIYHIHWAFAPHHTHPFSTLVNVNALVSSNTRSHMEM